MCWAKIAPLVSLAWLGSHLFVHGVICPGRTAFSEKCRPFLMFHIIAFIGMEFFDYALWRANEEHRCYDLVTVAGTFSIISTMLSVLAMVWYHRGNTALTDWDSRLFFLNCLLGSVCFVYFSETDSELIPKGPYRTESVNRNIWYTDQLPIALTSAPLYILPLLRGWWDTRNGTDRFSRLLFQIISFGLVSLVIAVSMSIAAWGSIWCITASLVPVFFDVHFVLEAISTQGEKSSVQEDSEHKSEGSRSFSV